MPSSSDVRLWGARQDPALAKPSTRGRLSKACVDAYNAAHPADPYETAQRPVPHILPVPGANGDGQVDDAATHAGTVENPSAQADLTEPLQDDMTPFTHPTQAGDAVTGEQVTQFTAYQNPAADTDYSDGSDYDVTQSPNVHYVNFSAEPYEETP